MEDLFGEIEVIAGPALNVIRYCRVATWTASSTTLTVNLKVPTWFGPAAVMLFKCPSAVTCMFRVARSTSPVASGNCCDHVYGAPAPADASRSTTSYGNPAAPGGAGLGVAIVSGS